MEGSLADGPHLYFGYGSNLSAARMESRVGAFASRSLAVLPGHRLTFDKAAGDGSGYATVTPDPLCLVEGALYEVDADAILQLDGYEGVAVGHYTRERMTVCDVEGGSADCWVYVAAPSRCVPHTRPRRDYLAHLLAGEDLLSASYFSGLRRWEALIGGDEGALGGPESGEERLFVYGSLRPDDDSGMPWTEAFTQGMRARPARVFGARLFRDGYASAILGHPGFSVKGAVLDFESDAGAAFASKLEEADRIENYPDMYRRDVVLARLEEDGSLVWVHMYHRPDADRTEAVPQGDWLFRERS